MIDAIRQQCLEMVTRGFKPAAIIMSPPVMKRFLREEGIQLLVTEGAEGSGWRFEDLPIYRCWEIGGPTVVSRDVLPLLKREYRVVWTDQVDGPRSRSQYDLLF